MKFSPDFHTKRLSSCTVKSGEVTTVFYLTHHCTLQTSFTCCSMTIPPHVLSPSSMHVMLGTDFINTLTQTQTWTLIFIVIASFVDAMSMVENCASNPLAQKSVYMESKLPVLDCIVDAAALAICSIWTTFQSYGLCGLLRCHEGWWQSVEPSLHLSSDIFAQSSVL